MDKLQFLLKAEGQVSYDTLAEDLHARIVPRLAALSPAGLNVVWTNEAPPRLSLTPFRRSRVALISVWTEDTAQAFVRVLEEFPYQLSGYRVRQAIPRAYERDWPDGERTPGVGMLTLLRRKRGLDDQTFFHRWHDVHSVHTLELHPIWNYSRNVVMDAVVPGSPGVDGIVEEHVRHRAELLSLFGFFGGPVVGLWTALKVAREVFAFIDLRTIEVWLVEEQWVVTPRA
jgi:hypothetical protein